MKAKRKKKIVILTISVLLCVLCFNIMAGLGVFRTKPSEECQPMEYSITGTEGRQTDLIINAHDGLSISATLFNVDNPKATVQIVHGATEHKELYYEFAQFLNRNDYAVIISDNRGHGATINDVYNFGYMNGVDEMVDDLYRVTQCVKQIYPDTPAYMVGHSLGSVLARCYLQEHDNEIEKLVLTGTANYIDPVDLGLFIGTWATTYSGPLWSQQNSRCHRRFYGIRRNAL